MSGLVTEEGESLVWIVTRNVLQSWEGHHREMKQFFSERMASGRDGTEDDIEEMQLSYEEMGMGKREVV